MQYEQSVPLILASRSPRRRRLLEQAGITFSVVPSAVEETAFPLRPPRRYAQTLAEAKAHDVACHHPESWVIGADTVVVVGDTVFGKPSSCEEAVRMLELLSGRTHRVVTGFCLCCRDLHTSLSDAVTSHVRFKELTRKEVDWYVRTREPFDKAGGYAIQGLGSSLVRSVHGSYTSVVGLPVCEVIELLVGQKVIRRCHGKLPDPDLAQ